MMVDMVIIWLMMVNNGNIWRFPARHGGTPIAGWFTREHPINIDNVGGPLF